MLTLQATDRVLPTMLKRILKSKIDFRTFVWIIGGGTALCSLAGWFESAFWMFDLCSHFRVQYLVLLTTCVVALVVLKSRKSALVLAIFAVANAAEVAPYLALATKPSTERPDLVVCVANVNSANEDHGRLLAFLEREAPDLVVTLEVNDAWASALSTITNFYPYQEIEARDDNFGIALLSRHPFQKTEVVSFDSFGVPTIIARTTIDDRPLTIIATHPVPPGGADYVADRNEQLQRLGVAASEIEEPLLVAGDLNTTQWNNRFKDLVATSGLKPSSMGRGFFATWPSTIPPLRIPIDHVLHSRHFRVLALRAGSPVGSDHLPLLVSLKFVAE